MTSIIAVVQIAAFLTAVVLVSICLVSSTRIEAEQDLPLTRKSPPPTVDERKKTGDSRSQKSIAISPRSHPFIANH